MIEKYLYSIPKIKKIFFCFLLSWLFISLISTQVNCGVFASIFGWIGKKATENITDEIFTSMNESLGSALGSMLDWFFNRILKPFGPDLTTFTNNTKLGDGVSLTDFLDKSAIYIGMFISTLIYGFSMILYFFSGKFTDSKDTPISLTGRYVLAITICYKHKDIYTTVLKIIDDFFTAMTDTMITSALSGDGCKGLIEGTIDTGLSLLGEAIVIDAFPGVGLVILIIQIILIWKLIKGFIKLYAEMVSRYIVTMVLVLMFAAFGGTIVSNNTSQIFKSYLRTLFCSFLVLVFNIVWFKGCFVAFLGGLKFTLVKYIFMLELLAFGLKFDGMLRSMGLGVATGGSRIGAAIGGAGRNLANSLRNANDARKAGGKLLQAGGLATGNKKMFDAGTKLGAGLNQLASGKKLDDPSIMAAQCGANNTKMKDSDVSKQQAAGILSNAMKNPGDKDAMNAMKGLSENKIKEGAQALAQGSGIKINDAKVCQVRGADGQMHAGLKVNGERTMADGSTHAVKGIISDADAFNSSQDLGNNMGFQSTNSLKNGETCNVAEAADLAGQDAADALTAAKENGANFGDGGYIEKAGRDSNGLDAFNCYDGDGNQLGTISGNEFIASSDANASSGDDNRFADAHDAVMGNGQNHSDVSDFTATGFRGTTTAEDGSTSSLSASFEQGEDGTRCTVTGESGQEASFSVPDSCSSYEDALSSDAGREAVSSVGGNADDYSFTPSEYTATATNEDGSTSDYKLSFSDNGDGTQTGTLTDSDGYASSFETSESSIGNDIRSELADGERFDSVSAFEPVEGNEGVYRATGIKGDTQTEIYATDKGIHAESRLNNDTDSFMYSSKDSNGNNVKYDVNIGKSHNSSEWSHGGNRSYGYSYEEEKVGDEGRERINGRNDAGSVGSQNRRKKRKR